MLFILPRIAYRVATDFCCCDVGLFIAPLPACCLRKCVLFAPLFVRIALQHAQLERLSSAVAHPTGGRAGRCFGCDPEAVPDGAVYFFVFVWSKYLAVVWLRFFFALSIVRACGYRGWENGRIKIPGMAGVVMLFCRWIYSKGPAV